MTDITKIENPTKPTVVVSKINELIDNKQDTLVSGTNIKTINNESILGEGNITIGSSSVSYDNATINENSSNELQTIGVVNANVVVGATSPLKLWEGTENQYNQAEATTWYNWVGIDSPYNISTNVPAAGGSGFGTVTWSTNANRIKNCGSLYIGLLQFAFASQERLIYTSNGLAWNTTSSLSPTPEGIAYGNNVYVMSGYGGITYTTDFQTFTRASNENFGGVDFGNGVFVAWNRNIGNISTSTTGQSWIDNTVALPATLNNETDVFHVGNFFVLNERPSGTPSKTFYIASDSDTTTWTAQTTPDNNNLRGIVYGNNKYVMLTSGKNVYVSTDNMVTWTLATTLTGTSAIGIAFGDNKFVVAMSNRAYMSTDTTTWSDFIDTAYPDSLTGCVDVCFGTKFVFLFGQKALISLGKNQSTTVYSYTLSSTPEVNDAVYLEPNTATTLYVTATETDLFTASDNITYTYNSSGNITTYQSIGNLHPTWLCNIEGMGVKIGTTDIANLVSYSAFSGATGSAAGSTGLVPAPTATDNDKYLKGDGTWATVSSGQTYTAGTGIDITNNVISVDSVTPTEVTLATVATSGDYTDLSNTPTIFTGATGSVAGNSGLVPAPTTSDVDKYLKGDGTWATAGSSVSFDGTTINENASNELQVLGVKEARTDIAIRFWHGTQDQWNIGGGTKDLYYNWNYDNTTMTDISNLSSSFRYYGLAKSDDDTKVIMLTNGSDTNVYNYSTDGGDTWISSTFSNNHYWSHAAYGNGKFVVACNGYFDISTDLSNWTEIIGSSYTSCKNGLVFGNNTFVGVDVTNRMFSYSTDDGSTWTHDTLPGSADLIYSISNSLAFGNNIFIIITRSGGYYYSATGTSWTYDNLPNQATNTGINYINNTFIIYSFTDKITVSTDGRNWREITIPITNNAYPQTASYGNGTYILWTYNRNTAYVSQDLEHWKAITLPTTKEIYNSIYTDKFIIVGEGVKMLAEYNTNNVYTLDENPTTSSQVYSAPETTSTLTITSVGTSTITLSDTNIYTYNADGNVYSYYSVGESYPNYICFIDNVGVKIGNTNIITVDQTYNASSTNAQSGVAVANGISNTLGTVETLLSQV